MKQFKNRSTSDKIALVFGVCLVASLVSLVFTLKEIDRLERDVDYIDSHRVSLHYSLQMCNDKIKDYKRIISKETL